MNLIKPGWKAGTKITFSEDEIEFIIAEKPHSVFKRDADNLRVTIQVSLAEALCGFTRSITTLDGRRIEVKGAEGHSTAAPGRELRVTGEGMPNSKTGRKGDLLVEVRVKFPERINPDKKNELRQMLSAL